MNKNIEVVDEAGNVYEPTWPKRAKGLVKHGRARFVDENRICLTCPPDIKTEETHMCQVNTVFGGVTVADILKQIDKVLHHTNVTYVTYDTLTASMIDGGSKDAVSEATANTYAAMVMSREATNQQLLRLYERMYDDMIRLSSLPAQQDGANSNE